MKFPFLIRARRVLNALKPALHAHTHTYTLYDDTFHTFIFQPGIISAEIHEGPKWNISSIMHTAYGKEKKETGK